MNKRMNRKGFTLAEVLIVVAILVVLASVGTVALVSHMRNMAKLEMDGQAKEIFVAAQNHLSMADSQGYMGTSNFGADDEKADPDKGVFIFYYIVNGASSFSDDPTSVLNQMLPRASMDETARLSGSYIIRYQKDPAQVLDVFYVSKTGRYTLVDGFDDDDYDNFMDFLDGEELDLKNYGDENAVVGYYGGTEVRNLNKGDELLVPTVEIINGEQLIVKVTDHNGSTNGGTNMMTLVFTDITGKELSIPLKKSATDNLGKANYARLTGNPVVSGDDTEFTLIIDDVTSQKLHFAYDNTTDDISDFKGKDFTIGEDITVYAVAYNNSVLTNIAQSVPQDFNSLFASRSGKTAKIGCFRHLLNLDTTVSGITSGEVTAAEQIANLTWTSSLGGITNSTGSDLTVSGKFYPVTPAASSFTYDGKDLSISDLVVDVSTRDAGLFADFSSGTIKDLVLKNFTVKNTGSGNAGALAGSFGGTLISGVLAYNTADATSLGVTSASGSAGGLVGKMTAGKVDKSAAAVYVSATAGNAGGLIGFTDGTVTVSNSYSGGHTEGAKYRNLTTTSPTTEFNVQSASGNAGGLIGAAAGASLSVGTSYSTASAKAEAENTGAGGLIGNTSATTVTINNSYATGLALTGDKATTGAFVALSTSTITGEGNKFLSSLNASPSNLDSLGYTLAAATSSDAAFCIPTTPTDTRASAVPYDTALITGFGGKYSFPTIDQLNAGDEDYVSKSGITDRHYGDWQMPTMEILNYTLTNSDTLFTDITFKENTRYVTMVLFGETSKAATAFLLQLSDSQSNATIVDTGVLSTDEREITWRGEPNEGVVQPGFNVDAEKKTLTITFDDITTAKGHFASIFPNLVPGENVTLFAAGGKCSWAELQTLRTKVYPDDMENPGEIIALSDNSLFATPNALEEALTKLTNVEDKYKASGEYVTELTKKMSDCPAEVKNPRHLQNLDTSVSNINAIASELTDEEIEEGTKLVTAAKLVNNIDWADKKWNGKESESDQDLGWKTKKIYQYNSTTSTDEAGQFNGIYNETLTEFDGDNKTIKGMIISNTFGQGAGNAGLFRYVDNALTIKNLRLSEIEVDGDSGNAGAFVGEKAGSGLLTLDTVLADAESKEITGTNAGGLVGLSSTNLTITNSAASMLVTASGAAGGLVGEQTAGTLEISESYVGGHTTGGLYTWIDDSDGSLQGNWNIVSNNGPAGGLIGWLNEDASLKIEKAFNAATVKAKDGCAAGGLVGLVDGTTSGLVLAYVIAPVYDVKEIESYEYDEETGTYSPKYTTTGGTSGSLFGMTANDIETASDSVFFLPDVYNDPLPSEIELTEEDETIYKTNISYVGGDGAGGVSNVSLASYFVDEDSASSNLIGVDHMSLLEEMTSPFDPVLRGRYEYPFALWTSFSFESDSPIRYFYGDWQPILNDNTVRLHVHFRPKITKIVDGVSEEVDPSSSTVDELAARETNIAVQIPYRPIEILLPYPASISEFGYHINDWALYYGDQTSGNLIVYDEDGMPPSVSASLSAFTLSSQQFKYAQDKGKDSNDDIHITIVANYSEDIDKHYKLQLWDWDKDVNPLGSVYTEHGSYMVMPAKDEDKQDIPLKTMLESKHLPMLNMPGYRFRGWYTEKDGGGTRVYTTVYDAENKKFVMTYTGDETVTVSETGDLDLYAWYEKVPQQAVDLEFYLKVDDDVDPVYYNSYTFSFDAEKGLSSSLPYPGSNLTYLSKQWLDETEGATEPATITNDGTSQLLLLTVAPSEELHNDPPVIRYRIVFRGQAAMDGYAVLYELEHTKKNEDGTYSYAPPTAVSTDIPDFGTSCYVAQFAGSKGQNIVPVGKSPRLSREDYPAEIGFVYSSTNVYDLSDVNTVLPDKYSGIYEGSFELSEDTDAPTYTVRYVVVVKYARARYELTYDSDGGTSYAPEKVEYDRPVYEDFLEGKTPVYGSEEDAAYTFLYWSMPGDKDHNIADADPPVRMPNSNLKVIAQKEGKTVKFTVAFWYENANDSGYAFAGSKVFAKDEASPSGDGGSGGTTTKRAGDDVYSSYFRNYTGFAGYDASLHRHFTYNGSRNEKVTLNGSGSSVVNVYFTRDLVTLTFTGKVDSATSAGDANPALDYVYKIGNKVYPLSYENSYLQAQYTYTWTDADDAENTYYALVNGEYLPLTRGEGTTTYRWKPAYTYTFVSGRNEWMQTNGDYYGIDDGKYVKLTGSSSSKKYFTRGGQEEFEASSVAQWYRTQGLFDTASNCVGIRDGSVVDVYRNLLRWYYYDTNERYSGTVYVKLSNVGSDAYEFYNGSMVRRTLYTVNIYTWTTPGGGAYSTYRDYGNNDPRNTIPDKPHFKRDVYRGDYQDVGKIYLDENGEVADMNAITTGITYYYATSTPQDTLHNNAIYPVYAPLKQLESADVTTEYVWNYTVNGETKTYEGQRYARSASEWTGGVYSGEIYTKSGAEYTAVSGDPGTLNWDVDYYGVDVNGGHVRLRSVTDSAWIWYDQDGVGTVYSGTGNDFYRFKNNNSSSGASVTMTWRGKWRAKFETYNFDWSMIDAYSWQHGNTTDTYLYAFVMGEYDNPSVKDYLLECQGANGTKQIRHYRQELDGSYIDDPAIAYSATTTDYLAWTFTNKFDEFEVATYDTTEVNYSYRYGRYDYSLGDEATFSPSGGSRETYDEDAHTSQPYDIAAPLFIYHERREYDLVFNNNGTVVKTVQVKYDRPLEQIGGSVPADSTLTPPGDGYEFKGWCLSSAMNSETIYFGEGVTYDSSDYITMNMPDGARVLYAKWVQPDKTLTFGQNGVTWDMDAPQDEGGGWTITVPYGTSVESVAGSQGWWKTDYQPRTTEKVADANGVMVDQTFDGWRYTVTDSDGNPVEMEYFISQGLTSDLTVYPHWKHENAPATSTVTVYYVKVGTADDQLVSPAQTLKDAKTYQLNVGETIDEVAENVGEEWSITGSGWVSREAKNAQETIVFYYESTEWTYTVEYYVRLSSLPEKETWVPGTFEQMDYSPETPIITYGPGTANVPTAYGRFALVSISPIPGYSLDEVVYPDGNGVKSSKDALILLARGTNVVVKAYIVPDGETILEQNVWAHSFTGVNQGIDDLYNAPDGIDMHYLYYQEGVLMQSNGAPVKPLNAGVYGVRAYATRSVEVDGETKTFLLWQSQDIDGLPGLTFYINRLDVLLTSNSVINVFDNNKNTKDYFDSVGRVKSEYASQLPENAQLVTSVPNGVVRDTGVVADLPDGVTVNYAVTFAADSFRRTPSKTPNDYTPNVFSYKLTSGSTNNYNFYLTYGRLYLWSDKAIYDQYMLQLSQEQQDQNEGG